MPDRVTRPSSNSEYDQRRTINDLVSAVNLLGNENDALRAQLASLPPILSLKDISHGLSAAGAEPLNISNLIGKPVGS